MISSTFLCNLLSRMVGLKCGLRDKVGRVASSPGLNLEMSTPVPVKKATVVTAHLKFSNTSFQAFYTLKERTGSSSTAILKYNIVNFVVNEK